MVKYFVSNKMRAPRGNSYPSIPFSLQACTQFKWTRLRKICAVVASLVVISILFSGSSSESYFEEFVSIKGNQLELHCRPYYISGFNTHDLVQNAMILPADYQTSGGLSGDQMVKNVFTEASMAGLNVARTWAHTNHPRFPFQESPGVYSQQGWQALDLVVEVARRRGMRLILSVVDNWKYYNGVDMYVDWSHTAPKRNQTRPIDQHGDPTPLMYHSEAVKQYEVQRHSLFFTDADCKRDYKAHVAALLNRVNSYSGIVYKDDSTILGWDLVNEPRCETWLIENCSGHFQNWVDEMSAFVKGQTQQLVLVGSEGFYSEDSDQVGTNPQDWAAQMGQNFTGNSLPTNIDAAAIHIWPNNWERTSDEFLLNWIESHVASGDAMGKPLLLEEFGKKLHGDELNKDSIAELRDHVYQVTYDSVERHIKDGSSMAGSLYWRWNLPMFDGEGPGDYGVDPSDTTFKIIKKHSRFIHDRINSRPPRESCEYPCYIPQQRYGLNTCRNVPAACAAYWLADAENAKLPTGPYFTSKEACCKPGLGAYEAGCTWLPV